MLISNEENTWLYLSVLRRSSDGETEHIFIGWRSYVNSSVDV